MEFTAKAKWEQTIETLSYNTVVTYTVVTVVTYTVVTVRKKEYLQSVFGSSTWIYCKVLEIIHLCLPLRKWDIYVSAYLSVGNIYRSQTTWATYC